MDIFLSIHSRQEVIRLPVLPKEFKIKSPYDNTNWDTVTIGKIKLIGQRGLQAVTISSFFPAHDYPFVRGERPYSAWDYVATIERWRDQRIPVRLIITDTPINVPMAIDSFEYGPQDRTGDVYYTLVMEEFKFPVLEQQRVM